MGLHYIPQQYLGHFAAPNDRNKIWMYDRHHPDEPKLLPIVTVAQSPEFYTDSDERDLSQNIEGPAHRPTDLLRNGQDIDPKDRTSVSRYLESMIKRVPALRSKLISQLPSTKREVIADILRNIEPVAAKLNTTPSELRKEIEQWDEEVNATRITDKSPVVSPQWTSPDVVGSLYAMTWRVIRSGRNCFLTSDNPVFFDERLGLKNPYSEVSFPLGSNVALHASWQGPQEALFFFDGNSSLIDELNRRTAFNTDRFAFYHTNSPAIPSLISTRRPQLHPILWQGTQSLVLTPDTIHSVG